MIMSIVEEYNQLCFEEAMSCLPSHVAAEVSLGNESHGEGKYGLKLSAETAVPAKMKQQSRNSGKVHHKPRIPTKRASGGPGMQAIFLDFDGKSCGTGVFLPRGAGTNFQPSKKPASYPVLLPCGVVQALNLHAHACLHVSPRQGDKIENDDNNNNNNNNNNNFKAGDCCTVGNETGKEESKQKISEDIFLPKEWTY